MQVTLLQVLVVAATLVGEIMSTSIAHPFGAFSYIRTHFPSHHEYGYINPTGQLAKKANHPQISAFDRALSSFFALNADTGYNYNSRIKDAPRAENLFVPSFGAVPAESKKQVQAYNDYVSDLLKEDSTERVNDQASNYSEFWY